MELVVGSVFICGSIAPYVTSYLRLYDNSVNMSSFVLVLPIMIIIASIIMYFSAFLNTMIHPRWILSIATLSAVAGSALASITTSFN